LISFSSFYDEVSDGTANIRLNNDMTTALQYWPDQMLGSKLCSHSVDLTLRMKVRRGCSFWHCARFAGDTGS